MRHALAAALLLIGCAGGAFAQSNMLMPSQRGTGLQPRTHASQNWYGDNATPPCQLASAATVAVNAAFCPTSPSAGIHMERLTLSANTTLGFPANLLPGTFITFEFTQPSTGSTYALTLAPGYYISAGGSEPNLTAANGAVDTLACAAPSAIRMDCTLVNNYAPALTPAVVSSAIGSQCNTGTAGTTCTASLAVTQGNTLAVASFACLNNSGCTSGTGLTVSTVAGSGGLLGTCTGDAGSSGNVPGVRQEWWTCPIVGTGTVTVTVTWSTSAWYQYVTLVQCSGIPSTPSDGISNFATSTGSTASVTATGNTSQAIDLVLSLGTANGSSSPTWTHGSGQTALQQVSSLIVQYYLTSSIGTPSAAATLSLSLNPWGMGILVLK